MNYLESLESAETTEVYTFRLGQIPGMRPTIGDSVQIVFCGGRFQEAVFPFSGKYSREAWKALAEIAAKIEEIEHEKADRLDSILKDQRERSGK